MVRLVFGVHAFSYSILVQLVHGHLRSQRRDPGIKVGPRGTQRQYRFAIGKFSLVVQYRQLSVSGSVSPRSTSQFLYSGSTSPRSTRRSTRTLANRGSFSLRNNRKLSDSSPFSPSSISRLSDSGSVSPRANCNCAY